MAECLHVLESYTGNDLKLGWFDDGSWERAAQSNLERFKHDLAMERQRLSPEHWKNAGELALHGFRPVRPFPHIYTI
jgi:hypothetical protein